MGGCASPSAESLVTNYFFIEVPVMRRLSILALALLAVGCSSHSVTVSPSVLNFSAPGQKSAVSVTETDFRGTWVAHTSSSLVVTAAQTSPGIFTVTAVGVGTCDV